MSPVQQDACVCEAFWRFSGSLEFRYAGGGERRRIPRTLHNLCSPGLPGYSETVNKLERCAVAVDGLRGRMGDRGLHAVVGFLHRASQVIAPGRLHHGHLLGHCYRTESQNSDPSTSSSTVRCVGRYLQMRAPRATRLGDAVPRRVPRNFAHMSDGRGAPNANTSRSRASLRRLSRYQCRALVMASQRSASQMFIGPTGRQCEAVAVVQRANSLGVCASSPTSRCPSNGDKMPHCFWARTGKLAN